MRSKERLRHLTARTLRSWLMLPSNFVKVAEGRYNKG